MSVRGHMTVVSYPTDSLFTVSSQDPIYNFLEDHEETIDRRNYEGGGFIEVHIDGLIACRELELSDDQRARLERDIEEAGNSEWLLYDCY